LFIGFIVRQDLPKQQLIVPNLDLEVDIPGFAPLSGATEEADAPDKFLPAWVARVSDAFDPGRLEINREVAPADQMYAYAPELYFFAGRAAVRCIALAMAAAGVKQVHNILDFGSGFGRVLRYLHAAFPEAALTASEMRQDKLDWCHEKFGARGVPSAEDPTRLRFDDQFDLIWAGSILTHVGEDRWTDFVRLFANSLRHGGVVVFTVYGKYVADLIRAGKQHLNLTPQEAEELVRDYEYSGFGFRPSARVGAGKSDGDTIVSPAWVCRQLETVPSLELVSYTEHAWMSQDVVACASIRNDSL